jgi:hypothetical protein
MDLLEEGISSMSVRVPDPSTGNGVTRVAIPRGIGSVRL